jgi:hypothetical protein
MFSLKLLVQKYLTYFKVDLCICNSYTWHQCRGNDILYFISSNKCITCIRIFLSLLQSISLFIFKLAQTSIVVQLNRIIMPLTACLLPTKHINCCLSLFYIIQYSDRV